MKIKLKDENGKIFTTEDLDKVKIEPLHDEEGEYSVSKITNSQGETLDITKLKDSEDQPKEILITIEATHSGKNLNYGIYPEDSLVDDHKTYLKDFAKPLLKNHDTHSEPLGRVVSTDFVDSKIVLNKKAVELKIKVTDSDAIEKFIDGRYKTFSIGASANKITCDLCNHTIFKDGVIDFCGHWRGQNYELAIDGSDETTTKTAFWVFEDMYFEEISVVNKPADRNAQITGLEGVEDSVEDESDEDLINSISNALNDSEDDPEEPEEDESEEDKSEEGTDGEDPEEPKEDGTDGDDPEEDESDDSEEDDESEEDETTEVVENLKKENKLLSDSIEELKKENKALSKVIDKKEESVVDLKDDNEILEKENQILLTKLTSFAKKLKNQLENRLMDLKIVTTDGDVTDELKGKFTKEIKDLSISEMSDKINGLKRKIKPKKLADNTVGENNNSQVKLLETNDTQMETMGDFLEDLDK